MDQGRSRSLLLGRIVALTRQRRTDRPPHGEETTTYLLDGELRDWLIAHFGGECVHSESPIGVAPEDNPTSEPEPDLIVTYQSRRVTRGTNPKPEDLRLVVEVSDSTYEYDRKIKAALYARAGIREYWVLDIRVADAPRLVIHQEPKMGGWLRRVTFEHDADIAVLDGLTLRLHSLM